MVTLIMGGVILLLKWALLKKLSREEDEKAKEIAQRGDSTVELADVYKGNDEEEGMDGGIMRVANPMHSAAVSKLREDNAELREDNAELREDNTELREENVRLKERLRQNGTLEDGDDVEVGEETTSTTSIPQQDCLEADHSNVTSVPSADQATNRLAGSSEISGKRNALARKANPQPQSRTSGTTPEDASVEARVDEL